MAQGVDAIMNPIGATKAHRIQVPGGSAETTGPAGARNLTLRTPQLVPLTVTGGSARSWQPITVGIPFPKGDLTDPGAVCLMDSEGRTNPLQSLPLARWSDGSVKWLLLDFLLGPQHRPDEGSGDRVYDHRQEVRVSEEPQTILVETGAATFHLDRVTLRPFARVLFDGAELIKAGSSRIVFTHANGRQAIPRVERVVVEARGPVRATIRFEGAIRGCRGVRFVARVCFFAGTGLVRIRLTIHNPRRARHPGGLWDLGDAGSILFRDLSLELSVKSPAEPQARWAAEPGQAPRSTAFAHLEIYQESSGGENWRSRNHVDRNNEIPCSFRGYRVRADGKEQRGLRASPVVGLHGPSGGVTAALPEFWQQFPKALEVDGRFLRVRLFPGQFGSLFELQGGEQKTHTIWLDFGRADSGRPLDWVHQPALVQARSAWYAQSGAIPYLAPASEEADPRLETYLSEIVGGSNSFFARREIIDEYGWRNYGDVYADHEASGYTGPPPIISHYNNQYDMIYGSLLQYLRTADPRWAELIAPLARHVTDIDIYHTDQDKAAYNGGLFWLTDHFKDAATCTHRSYSRANCRKGDRSYGGGPGNTNNYTTGLLHYFYLTGDPSARSAVLSLADWVVNMDDGRKHVLGLLDGGPTGLATHNGEPVFNGPGRGSGNSVNALLDAWLLTSRRAYLDKAESLIRRVVHPADDVAAKDLLNVEPRWSYTVFLTVLARYLDLKAESGELDGAYAYGQASLLRYAAWMAEHEEPYLDHPEKLDYPNETWAAQEFRKANVFRLAAAHADEPLRTLLIHRGKEFAERAWADLLRFPARTVTRVAAILLVEGSKAAYFRDRAPTPTPHPPGAAHQFGRPQPFMYQKDRVAAQLKTASGLARTMFRLSCAPVGWAARALAQYCHPPAARPEE